MIGYYVHHVGTGHLHRARSIARACAVPVVGLSSLPRPDGWEGEWVRLARDDEGDPPRDETAGGRLHWAPLHDDGLRSRTAALSAWVERSRPGALVADVSVEVAVLARLHGVPVVSVVLPGRRTDPAHLLGFGVSTAILAAWPAQARGMLPGLPADVAARVRPVGAVSRFPVEDPVGRAPGRRVTVLLGRGGGAPDAALLDEAQRQAPDWEWTFLGAGATGWRTDPLPALRAADVVVTQAGQNSIAEVASLRRPAIVLPADRPHDEQRVTAAALARGGWPVLVEDAFPTTGWADRLETARELDGSRWRTWCDGRGAARAAEVLVGVHDRADVRADARAAVGV